VYERSFWLHISEAGSAGGDVKNVYEGTVACMGASGELGRVMPVMIKALFKDFPGRSGAAWKVRIAKD